LEQENEGSILIGLKSSGGPMPRVRDVLHLLTEASEDEILAKWRMERLCQWWEIGGRRYTPTEDFITNGEEIIPPTPLNKAGLNGISL